MSTDDTLFGIMPGSKTKVCGRIHVEHQLCGCTGVYTDFRLMCFEMCEHHKRETGNFKLVSQECTWESLRAAARLRRYKRLFETAKTTIMLGAALFCACCMFIMAAKSSIGAH